MDQTRRDILRAAAVAALVPGAGSAVLPAMAADAPQDRFVGVDPEMIDGLRQIVEMEVSAENLEAFRHRKPAPHPAGMPPIATVALPARMIPGLPGRLPVRIVTFDGAPGRTRRGAVVWMHGGGFVSGSTGIPADLRIAAQREGWLIVSVDYRLAPEATYRESLDDTYGALRWVHDTAAALGVDRARIAVGGASAGGGHAAMLALAARDRGEVKLAYQVLIYPMLDDRTGSTRPARAGTGTYIWTAASNRFGWSALLGQPAGGVAVPAAVVPARRGDLAGLPPAFIGVGTLDLFYDEDVAYAAALTALGVSVDLAVVPAAFHAFDGVAPQARASRVFTQRWIGELSRALA